MNVNFSFVIWKKIGKGKMIIDNNKIYIVVGIERYMVIIWEIKIIKNN